MLSWFQLDNLLKTHVQILKSSECSEYGCIAITAECDTTQPIARYT